MKIIITFISVFLFQSCATTSQDRIQFIDKEKPGCQAVASLSSVGFNIIPPVAKSLAKTALKMKAEEFGADSVMINEVRGTFQVEMRATGYRCL